MTVFYRITVFLSGTVPGINGYCTYRCFININDSMEIGVNFSRTTMDGVKKWMKYLITKFLWGFSSRIGRILTVQ